MNFSSQSVRKLDSQLFKSRDYNHASDSTRKIAMTTFSQQLETPVTSEYQDMDLPSPNQGGPLAGNSIIIVAIHNQSHDRIRTFLKTFSQFFQFKQISAVNQLHISLISLLYLFNNFFLCPLSSLDIFYFMIDCPTKEFSQLTKLFSCYAV